jgi:hypothetical protein
MKYTLLLGCWLLLAVASAQTIPSGTWVMHDSKAGKPLVHLRFAATEFGMRAYIVHVPDQSLLAADTRCLTCAPKDARYKKPLKNMEILSGARAAGTRWVQGEWLDIEKGFTYMAEIEVKSADELMLYLMYGKMAKPKRLTRLPSSR